MRVWTTAWPWEQHNKPRTVFTHNLAVNLDLEAFVVHHRPRAALVRALHRGHIRLAENNRRVRLGLELVRVLGEVLHVGIRRTVAARLGAIKVVGAQVERPRAKRLRE